MTYSDVEGGFTGTGNINNNPLFADANGADNLFGTLDDNLRLTCGTTAINAGHSSDLPADAFDLNLNNNMTEHIPYDRSDLSTPAAREVGPSVDMGAYEKPGACCVGDTDSNNNVNVNDLLNVITHWGTCTSTPCVGDVDPQPCGNGTVDVNDLLSVITHWGPCSQCGSVSGSTGSLPSTYNDCVSMCDGLTGQAWADCMNHCFQILCNRGHTEWCQ